MITYDGYKLDHWDLRDTNTSRKYTNGSRWCNKNGEWATIIGQLDKYDTTTKGTRRYLYFLIQFDDGHFNSTRAETIARKNIYNPYAPVVCGVGFEGQGPWTYSSLGGGINNPLYYVWNQMLARCYQNERMKQKSPTYADCSVDPRWHNFQNFCEDLSHMDNFDIYMKGGSNYQLDKDIKIKGNRLYSKETCLITTLDNNMDEMNKRVKVTGETYIAQNTKLGITEEFLNQREFCRKYELCQSNVWKCINGYYGCKSIKGWTFKIKEENK